MTCTGCRHLERIEGLDHATDVDYGCSAPGLTVRYIGDRTERPAWCPGYRRRPWWWRVFGWMVLP